MRVDNYSFTIDNAAKFFNTLRIYGWFHHPTDTLVSVSFSGQETLAVITEIGIPHGGVLAYGPNKGFSLQVLRADETLSDDAALTFVTRSGWTTTVPIATLCADRLSANNSHVISWKVFEALNAIPNARMLDIGGRDRSSLDMRKFFPNVAVTVLDILPGKNVDIVADAHALADHLPAESFDAVISASVFEHLLMPWAVIPQINRVLKPGGLVWISTHQTLGMHDIPWDFWRFSDTAWDALFNRYTGFDIVDRLLEFPAFIIPMIYTPIKAHTERAVGFESSAVLARKTGPCQMSWPLTAADLNRADYTPGTENPYLK